MNKSRRSQINRVQQLLNNALDILQDVLNEEDTAFNNLSEGLQCTMRGEAMENNIGELEESIEFISNSLDNLNNID